MNLMNIFVLLLSLLLSSQAVLLANLSSLEAPDPNDPCQDFFKQILAKPELIGPFLPESGKTLNDLGQYEQCNRNPARAYMTVQLMLMTVPTPTSFVYGWCGPNVCTQAYYSSFWLLNAVKINQALAAKGFPFGIWMSFYDPQDKSYSTNPGTYVSWTATAIVTILLIVGTAMSFLRKKGKVAKKKETSSVLPVNKSEGELETAKPEKTDRPNLFSQILLGFSVPDNFRRLIPEKEPAGDPILNVFHFPRVISMFSVVWGHDYYFRVQSLSNLSELGIFLTSKFTLLLVGAEFSVDIFFFLGGFFLAYTTLKKSLLTTLGPAKYLLAIIHRVARILPAYAFSGIIYTYLLYYIGEGPIWPMVNLQLSTTCKKFLWRDLLFISNFKSIFEGCIGWAWYLCVDMQIFIAMPLLLYLLSISRKYRSALLIVLAVISVVYSYFLAQDRGWVAFLDQHIDSVSDYYQRPWTRCPPYLLGMLTAVFYLDTKSEGTWAFKFAKNLSQAKVFQTMLLVLGVATMTSIIWMIEPLPSNPLAWKQWQHSLYIALSRPGFVVGMMLFLLPTICGGCKWMIPLFGNRFFAVGARLAYSMYLCHALVLVWKAFTVKNLFYFSHLACSVDAFGTLLMTVIVGALLYLLVELPFANIVSTLLKEKNN